MANDPLVIVTEHLVLRDFEAGDLDAMLAYQTDPRYLRYYARDRAERIAEEARGLLQRFLAAQEERPRTKFQLAMTLREDGKLIGQVSRRDVLTFWMDLIEQVPTGPRESPLMYFSELFAAEEAPLA